MQKVPTRREPVGGGVGASDCWRRAVSGSQRGRRSGVTVGAEPPLRHAELAAKVETFVAPSGSIGTCVGKRVPSSERTTAAVRFPDV